MAMPRKAPARKAAAPKKTAKAPATKKAAVQAPKKGAKAPARKASPRKTAPRKATSGKRAAPKPPAADAPPKPKKVPAAPRTPVEKVRVVVAKDLYEARKGEIKAPLRERGLKWQYLGEGKGRYHKEGVNLFVQFLDDGVHYSLWGDDAATVHAVSDAWRALLGEAVFAQAQAEGAQAERREEAQKESEAVALWRLQEPQRRPDEPDFFFARRVAEWQARKPQA